MKNEIICVMCIYNEETNLEMCLKHLEKYIDKFVIFDDDSTDNSVQILEKHQKVAKVIKNKKDERNKWKERYNREVVLREALKVSDTPNPWVLCIDPDERFEIKFLKKLRKITDKYEGMSKVITIHFRELWDNYNAYRVDGIWNEKNKGLLFQLSENMTFNYSQEHHIPWAYAEIVYNYEFLDYNLYHLKMIKHKDRQGRVDLYNKLDPEKNMQPIGYDYLVDKNNIKLEKIKFTNRYNYRLIPKYYK